MLERTLNTCEDDEIPYTWGLIIGFFGEDVRSIVFAKHQEGELPSHAQLSIVDRIRKLNSFEESKSVE